MSTDVLINVAPGETRLALVEDGRLSELVNSRVGAQSLVGAVYLGRVASVSKPLDAAFVDIGAQRPGLLAFGDTKEDAPKLIEGAVVLVRVLRDASEDKGPKLTARVDYPVPAETRAPTLIAASPDPVEYFLDTRLQAGWRVLADDRRFKMAEYYAEKTPIFAEHEVEEQLEAALQPHVPFGDGASLVIEETAALTAIDVNSGPRGDAFSVNLAAAVEVARQLRLRNIGGQIAIDFLPMKRRDRRDQVIEALRAAVAADAHEVHVFGLTRLGLAELTRRRVGETLAARLGAANRIERSPETATLDLLRALDWQGKGSGARKIAVSLSPAIEQLLAARYRALLDDLIRRHALQVERSIDPALAPDKYRL